MLEYQAGSLDAFRSVYDALAPPLRRYLRYLTRSGDLADDLLQETFLQMHRSRASYDPAYPVGPWAFGLARNVSLMHKRAAFRRARVHAGPAEMIDVPVPPAAAGLADADLVRRALAGLDADKSEPLLLHHVWGFSFDEIAGMLGVTAATARARSSRGMADLRAAVDAAEGSGR